MCVNTDDTAAYCGGCDTPCPMGESCQAGKCSGAIGDSCTSTLAVGISIDEISVYQVGKIPVMEANAVVAKEDRPADIVQGKPGRVRVFVKLESGWVNRTVSGAALPGQRRREVELLRQAQRHAGVRQRTASPRPSTST